MLYTVNTEIGMTIIDAKSKEQAFKKVRAEIGTYHEIYSINSATGEDIAWYKLMSGIDPTSKDKNNVKY